MSVRTKVKIAIATVALVLAALLPEVVSGGWHLFHGRSVTYRTWNIVLPFDWYAMKHGEGMTIESMSRLPWRQGPMAFFQPVHFTKTFPFNFSVYGKVQAQSLEERGYELRQEQPISIAGANGECWTFVSKTSPENLWIACIVPKDLTSADYIGARAYANTFDEILSNIKRSD
jgi:hypothetical protein